MAPRRKDLAARMLEDVRLRGLLRDGDRVLVAVSGGADSLVLLDCLARIRGALSLSLVIGHVDHGLRATSGDDARAVAAHAAALGLEARIRVGDVRGEARRRGLTLEEAGRSVRYPLLAELAAAARCRVTATGHTATDQAETVLMRLIRGTGPLGLAGIDPARGDGFVRPLLCATRAEVRRYARHAKLPFRDDETNGDQRHLRNRVRARLLPMLRRLNPRIEALLNALAEDAAGLQGLVERLADAAVTAGSDEHEVAVRRDTLAALDPALAPYVMLGAFRRLCGAPAALSRTHVEALVRLASDAANGAQLHLPRSVVATRDRQGLRLRQDAARKNRRP